MRHIFVLLLGLFLFTCDDGDIITIELDFDQELELCENNVNSFLVYDVRDDPSESLILTFPRDPSTEALFTTPTLPDQPAILDINGGSIRFNFRGYNRNLENDELCELIPPANLVITEDYDADSGHVFITVTAIDDDNDGVPSALEDINGNGDLTDDDTDSDGIPNYIDEDDDNDNVKTSDELDNLNLDGDNNPLTNPIDTDGDGTPNFLDNDDDGDFVLTRLEDQDCNNNPQDDRVINPDGSLGDPFYLVESVDESYPCTTFITNSYTRTIITQFRVEGVNLGPVNATEIDFGTYESSFEVSNE